MTLTIAHGFGRVNQNRRRLARTRYDEFLSAGVGSSDLDPPFLVDADDPDAPAVTFGGLDDDGRPGVLHEMLLEAVAGLTSPPADLPRRDRPVAAHEYARTARDRGDQLEGPQRAVVGEDRLAAAEDDRLDVEPELVDQALATVGVLVRPARSLHDAVQADELDDHDAHGPGSSRGRLCAPT
jgi:hypothetical protein